MAHPTRILRAFCAMPKGTCRILYHAHPPAARRAKDLNSLGLYMALVYLDEGKSPEAKFVAWHSSPKQD